MKRLTGALLLLLLLGGCTPRKETQWVQSSPYTVGVVLKAMNSPHWLDMRAGLNDAAREANINLILLYPEQEEQAQEQARMFYDLVAQKPDLILLAPCDSESVAPLAQCAQEAGIPLVTLDTAASDVHLPYIGADNERIGRMAATRLCGLLGQEGKLAVISGVDTQSSHVERLRGFRLALIGHPDVSFVRTYYGNSDFTLGMQSMAQAMQDYPDLGGVFCTNAVMALGAIEELQSGKYAQIPAVVAVDTQDDALAALSAGTLQGLVSQDGYEAGCVAIEQALMRLDGKQAVNRTYIKTDLLTKETVGAFLARRMDAREVRK